MFLPLLRPILKLDQVPGNSGPLFRLQRHRNNAETELSRAYLYRQPYGRVKIPQLQAQGYGDHLDPAHHKSLMVLLLLQKLT